MRKIVYLFTFLGLFLSINYQAQHHEFLKIPKFNDADLSKEKSLIDEKAPAEILYRSLYYRIDIRNRELVKKVFYRMKIYDKSKVEDWLSVEIPIHIGEGGRKENLYGVRAHVYNLENGKKQTTNIDRKSKYTTKEDKYTEITKFTFPDIKNGSVIEYEYEIRSPFLYRIPTGYISLDIPSVYTEYVLEFPKNMTYGLNYTGALIPKYRKSGEELTIYGMDYYIYAFGYENLEPFKKERFVKNNDNYRTKIKAELHSTNFGEFKAYSSTWEEINHRMSEEDDFGIQLKKGNLVKKNMPKNLLSAKTDIEKANQIFNEVKNNYTWNKKFGVFTENGIRKTIDTKTGNIADLNLLLIMMFREAGLNANPLLISTVKHGVANFATPNITNFNAVLACVDIKGEIYVYDATIKQSSANMLPPRDWNGRGLLFVKEKNKTVNLVNNSMSENKMTIKAKLNTNGAIEGIYQDVDTGTYAMATKTYYDENPEKYQKSYQKEYAVDFSNVASQTLENGDFKTSMDFSSQHMVDIVGKKIIINPMLFLNKKKNEFNQTEERLYPIDFLSAFTRTKNIEIEIPEGYVVASLPEDKKILTEDNEIEYLYKVEEKEGKIILTSHIKVASPDYPKEYYPAFKQVWDYMIKAQNQVVSLKKK